MNEITLTVAEHRELKEQGDLFGIFFEDLNHAADGGLYGELVRNRSFEFNQVDKEEYHALTSWETVERGGSVVQAHAENRNPLGENNANYLVLEVMNEGGGGIRNKGYNTGIPVIKGSRYLFSCFCRTRRKKELPFAIRLEDLSGRKCYAQAEMIACNQAEWVKNECVLEASETDYEARLAILLKEPSCLELDMVSLFPEDTFKYRRNGLRRDIAEMLYDMKPGFMRFPGGCLIHIGSLDADDRTGMYRWKNTVGPLEERPSRRNTWNYNQTLGLGFYEFFQFCEDIGATPLPVIAAGYDPHFLREVPLEDMQEWIDEALDLIEFANGSTSTKWGALREQMGHPESFHMKYLGIGNEEVGDAFFRRYEIILKAVKEKYPEIQVITSAGPGSAGSEFHKGWKQAAETPTSYVDEHFYQCPEWFIANAHRYECYTREPKAFLGEYASHDDTWFNALAEAAFMIGLEKAPGVGLACYAPMLNNVGYSNWNPTLLYFDNHQVYGSPSYYVQKLFMNYAGKSLVETAAYKIENGLKPKPVLTGACRMCTDRALVRIEDMIILNEDTGEQIDIGDFRISEEKKEHRLADIEWENYCFHFKFCKENGETEGNLNGKYSFRLDFAMKDEDNRIHFTVDGWQRLTSFGGVYYGQNCDMGLYHFITEKEQIYRCTIRVQGNRISAYIDDKLFGEHTCLSVQPDDLYYSSVKGDAGNIIIKLVNLKDEAKKVHIALKDNKSQVKILSMSGFELTDRNSFEEPRKIFPEEKTEKLERNYYTYDMPGYAFVVLEFN